ncbi:MAG: hypothetical protein JSS65_07710 [Armatimonadetes bacterium]|nr:hypothetical protein [Armatimonadota bacterium]
MFAVSLIGALVLATPKQDSLDPHLEPFKPLLGMTFKGVFKKSTPENPIIDVTHWERAMNGKAVRFFHSVNDGAYGGETIFRWDPEKNAVTGHYFTTANFMTVGTVTFERGELQFHDKVVGQAGDTVAVEATISFNKEGGYTVRADAITKTGEKNSRETVYKPDLQSRVVFK